MIYQCENNMKYSKALLNDVILHVQPLVWDCMQS